MPFHTDTREFDRRVLQLGLARDRVDNGIHGSIDAAGARDLRRPVHRRKGLAGPHRVGEVHAHRRATPTARQFGNVAVL
jgi:hypothetical protein